jgi:hypothetical protein
MTSYRVQLRPDGNDTFLLILDLNHATNLAKIEHAFEVPGKKLLVDVRDADDKAA